MNLADWTAAIIVVVAVLLIAWDVYAMVKDKSRDSTISWVMLTASKKWPVIAFAFGFLCGHLFFQNCTVN
jgi:hypothetical protein